MEHERGAFKINYGRAAVPAGKQVFCILQLLVAPLPD